MTQKQINNLSIIDRATAKTPKFFKVLKIIGLSLAAVSGTIATGTIALPLIVIKVAGYIAVAGAVATAVSQVTVEASE